MRGAVNGTAPRSLIAVYGSKGYLGLTREVRAAPLAGDTATSAASAGLAPTHRREYARWVADAKRADTRERRIVRSLEMLREGIRHPCGATSG